jgi:GPH family glycoside/pentoside/hexuronide:cation symporter
MWFLPIFYTDTFGISAAFVGGMFFVVRIIDTITDPIMGLISDRTETRWGKFRPWILWAAVPYCVFGVLMFITPGFSESGKQAYAFVTYTVMMVVYTMMMIPYSSLTGVMTSDHVERTSLSSFRFVGAYSGTLAVQGTMLWLVARLGGGNDQLGFPLAMALFGVICLALFLYAFAQVRERVRPPKEQDTSLKRDLGDLLRNGPWVILFLVSLVTLIYIPIRAGVTMYYFRYYLDAEPLAPAFMASGTVLTMLGVTASGWLTRRFGKRNAYIGCMALIAATLALHYIARPDDVVLLFVLNGLYSLASGPTMPIVWSMYADSADYSEWKHERRATGLVYSASTLAYKAGVALGGVALMWILTGFGYVANQAQTDQALLGMRLSMSVIPAALALVTVALLLYYPLSDRKLDEIQRDLEARRQEV